MRKAKIVFFTAAAMMFSAAPTVAAEELRTTLQRSDVGLLGAMARNGCGPSWLASVMGDNGILEVDLKKLWVGRELTIRDCQGEELSGRDAARSRAILRNQSHQARLAQAEVTPPALLGQQYADMVATARNWEKVANEQKEIVRSLELQLAAFHGQNSGQAALLEKFEKQDARRTANLWLAVLYGFLAALLAAATVAVLMIRRRVLILRSQVAEFLPKPVVVKPDDHGIDYFGERILFRDTTQRTVGCLHCGESNLKDDPVNKRNHLNKHPHLRVQEVDPKKFRELVLQNA